MITLQLNTGGPATIGPQLVASADDKRAVAMSVQHQATAAGLTFCFRTRAKGSGVAIATAPRTASKNACKDDANAVVTDATDITATTIPQRHSVLCDVADLIVDVLTNPNSAILTLWITPVIGGS